MFTMLQNQRRFYFANFNGEVYAISEATGLPNGEKNRSFDAPAQAWGNISPAAGRMSVEAYGFDIAYDLTIIPADDAGEIREGARLWIKKDPTKDETHDYTVVRVSESLNELVLAARKVEIRA